MRNLPVAVEETEIDEMFRVADDDGDGKIGFEVVRAIHWLLDNLLTVFQEFCRMIHPPPLPKDKKPTKAEIASHFPEDREEESES